PPPPPTLFPYTTLFRSCDRAARDRQRDRQTRGTAVLRCANSRLVITRPVPRQEPVPLRNRPQSTVVYPPRKHCALRALLPLPRRSEEHTSELQSQSNLV